jgi:hypothetical protein
MKDKKLLQILFSFHLMIFRPDPSKKAYVFHLETGEEDD